MTAELAVKTYHVPATLDKAVEDANILGELAMSATWKRAAIVRAFVSNQEGRDCSKVSISHFASRKIVGLKSRNSIQRYYDAWDLTGLPEPEPGKPIQLPPADMEFPAVERRPEPVAINPPSESEPEYDDDEIIEGEIVYPDEPSTGIDLPPNYGDVVKAQQRQRQNDIPANEHAWEELRQINTKLLRLRDMLRAGAKLDGPMAQPTRSSFTSLVSDIQNEW